MGAHPGAAHALRLVVPPQRAEHDRSERRAFHRRTLAELPWLREVRLKYGPRAVLIDLSDGGAQLETTGYPLNPGSTVVVEIFSDRDGSPIPSRVVRCQISGLEPEPVYRSALAFKRTLALPTTAAPQLGVDANPFHEHARLLTALRRFDGFVSSRDSDGDAHSSHVSEGGLRTAGSGVMSAVLAMIDTPAGRRAGHTFARELATLFSIVTQAIEEEASEEALIGQLLERLRRTIPVRAVRVTDAPAASHSDAIYFDVPSSGSHRAAKLVVELPRDFRFEEWQFQYLKAAAHFFPFVRQIGQQRAVLPPPPVAKEPRQIEDARPLAREQAVAPFSHVVVRYRDGRLLKGWLRDFLPDRGVAEVWPSRDAPPTARVAVPLAQLKAIFFVRDFGGDASHITGETSVTGTRGRKIAVTFTDGEQLLGVTLAYKPEGVGFFVKPLETQNNNAQVFVVSQSIRHVQFP